VTPPACDAPARPSESATALPSRAPAPSMSTRRYLQLVLVLGSLTALGPLTIDMYLPALPSLTEDLATTESAAQATITGMLIGLGVGQLVIGPLSDAVGRRRPLISGVVGHLLASVLCALAPSIALLTVARLLQGLAAAAIAVVSMAVVRDLFTGMAAATLLSRLMLVTGIAPVLAPSIGGVVLGVTSWRGVFVVLAVAAFVLLWVAVLGLRETLPEQRRRTASPGAILATYRGLLRDRPFVALVVISGLAFATLFSYISGSSFVLQNVYGLSSGSYALVFGVNSAGLVLATQVNPVLVARFGPRRVLSGAIGLGLGASVVLLAGALSGMGGLAMLLVPLWFVIASAGFIMPNTPALALTRHGESAGTAAALLGSAQFVIGGAAAPLVGAFGDGSAVPMGAVMAGAMLLAGILVVTGVRAGATDPEPVPLPA
jgi:DHA1 family bicyclomycin/chloramphenicol resistance-like MFS transporter